MMRDKNTQAFTLFELVIVVILVGIIAAFAVPAYQKTVAKQNERDAVVQLTSIHAANQMYRARNTGFLVSSGNEDLDFINTNLNINVAAMDKTYVYNGNASTFTVTADYDDGSNTYTLRVNESAISNSNPCCSAGSCPSRSAC